MNHPIAEAIENFPLLSWLEEKGIPHKSDGSTQNVYITCPVCMGKAKLGIHKIRKYWQCFKCFEGGFGQGAWEGKGSFVKLVCSIQKCTPSKAIKFIASRSGMPDLVKEQEYTLPKEIIPSDAIPLCETHKDHPSVKYLRSRGLERLREKSFVCVKGKYAGRLILPCYWFNDLVGFEAKSYCNQKPKALYESWFVTGDTIYTSQVWDNSIDSAIITESIFDAETLAINALGFYGARVTEGQLAKLLELKRMQGVANLFWLFDQDATFKVARIVIAKTAGFFNNYVTKIPEGADPNSLGYEMCVRLMRESVLVESEFDLLEYYGLSLLGD